jgi:hypothetical protein
MEHLQYFLHNELFSMTLYIKKMLYSVCLLLHCCAAKDNTFHFSLAVQSETHRPNLIREPPAVPRTNGSQPRSIDNKLLTKSFTKRTRGEYRGGGLYIQTPPEFRIFEKAEPNSKVCGRNVPKNLIEIRVSLICKLSGNTY